MGEHRSPTRCKKAGHSEIERVEQIWQEKRYKESKREEGVWANPSSHCFDIDAASSSLRTVSHGL